MNFKKKSNIILAILWTIVLVLSSVNWCLGEPANHIVVLCSTSTLIFKHLVEMFED